MWELATITDAGSNLLASWVSGTTLNITRAACGTGTVGSEDALYKLTALVDERHAMSIVGKTKEDRSVVLKLQATAAEEAFTMNQIAVFANVNDGPSVMLAIFEDPGGITIPKKSTTQEFLYNFYATIMINSSGKINVTIDTSVMVSLEDMLEHLKDKQDIIDTEGGLLVQDEDGSIRAATPEDLEGLGGSGTFYGTSDSIASDPSKEVISDGLEELQVGALVVVRFKYSTNIANPTMNVNELGELPIVSRGQTTLLQEDYWVAGDYILFMYDGKNWILLLKFNTYIPLAQKGVANGVATLAADGKVTPAQLRGGFVVQATEPQDKTLLWINNQVMKYYDATTSTWKNILPVWG